MTDSLVWEHLLHLDAINDVPAAFSGKTECTWIYQLLSTPASMLEKYCVFMITIWFLKVRTTFIMLFFVSFFISLFYLLILKIFVKGSSWYFLVCFWLSSMILMSCRSVSSTWIFTFCPLKNILGSQLSIIARLAMKVCSKCRVNLNKSVLDALDTVGSNRWLLLRAVWSWARQHPVRVHYFFWDLLSSEIVPWTFFVRLF